MHKTRVKERKIRVRLKYQNLARTVRHGGFPQWHSSRVEDFAFAL